MRRAILPALLALLAGAHGARALEATGTLKKVDAEKGTMVVFANGKDRDLKIADDVKVAGTDGKPLEGGIRAKELKEGTEVTITVDLPGDGGPILKAIRLGRAPLAGANAKRG